MTKKVVICGGGVIGAAVAYFLAKRGVASTIVEADGVASGASGAAAGILTPPLPTATDDPLFELRERGFAMHRELAASLPLESGVDYAFGSTPRVLLAVTPAEERELRTLAEVLAGAGGLARWLDRDALRERSGWIDRTPRGGLELEPSAQLDPYRYTLALVTAAERMGASLRSGTVGGLVRDGDAVSAVIVGNERIDADAVVVAMGPWTPQAEQWLGLRIPVEPLKGQILKVRPRESVTPFQAGHGGDYAVTRDRGLVYVGTTEERAGFDRSTTAAARDSILAFGVRHSSLLETAELVEQTACLRPLSGDGVPIIGPVPGLRGAYLATGHGRQGILQSPPTGQAIADLILDGETSVLDVKRYDPARFATTS